MVSEQLQSPVVKKKRFFFSPKKKSAKETVTTANRKNPKSAKSSELVQRAQFNSKDYVTSQKDSQKNLIAMAYEVKAARGSFQDTTKPPKAGTVDADAKGSSLFTGSSFFRKLCDDVFDTIDVDKSGKINETELYQGLLLIHLKLGMYFGPAACKPISLERANYIFKKLDTNQDGSLNKAEFRRVVALLMGNVVSRIAFQFVCTLLIVPFLANTILEKTMDWYGIFTGSVLPVVRQKYLPIITVALGVDLISGFASTAIAATNNAVYKTGIISMMSNITEVPTQFVAEKYEAFVLKPLADIPQETWDSIPLTVLSTLLALIIVPYSIVKTDDFFRYLATKSGGKV